MEAFDQCMASLKAEGGTSRKLSQAPRAKELLERHLDQSFKSPYLFVNNNLVANQFITVKVLALMKSPNYMSVEFKEELRIQRMGDRFHLEYFPFPYDLRKVKLHVSNKILHATYTFNCFLDSYEDC